MMTVQTQRPTSDFLYVPEILDLALDRALPSVTYAEWVGQLLRFNAWFTLQGRSSEAGAALIRWSAAGSNSTAADAKIIAAALKSADKAPDLTLSAGKALAESGLAADIRRGAVILREPSPEEVDRRERQRIEYHQRQREAEELLIKNRSKAIDRNHSLLAAAKRPADRADYVVAKCQAAGLAIPVPSDVRAGNYCKHRKDNVWWNNSLYVPLYEIGTVAPLHNVGLEIICGTANPVSSGKVGEKYCIPFTTRHGTFYPFNLQAAAKGAPIVICEGWASAWATAAIVGDGLCVLAAFSCGNFLPVVEAIRGVYPENPIFIIGDVGVGHSTAINLIDDVRNKFSRNLYAVDLFPCLPDQPGADPFDLLARHGLDHGRVLLRSLFRDARAASRDSTLSPVIESNKI